MNMELEKTGLYFLKVQTRGEKSSSGFGTSCSRCKSDRQKGASLSRTAAALDCSCCGTGSDNHSPMLCAIASAGYVLQSGKE